MFAYVGDTTFHVRFFKQNPKLARVTEQLNEKNTRATDIDDPRISGNRWRRRNFENMLN